MKSQHLTIEKAVYGGYGLGFLDGRAVFVDKAVPGDKVSVEIISEKKDHSFGRIAEIISPSHMRIKPLCESFHECGGCSYLCLNYDDEIIFKKNILTEQLIRIGGIKTPELPDIDIIAGERFFYRSHASIKRSAGSVGFFGRGTNNIKPFPPEGCLLLAKDLRPLLREQNGSGDLRVMLDSEGRGFSSSDGTAKIKEKELHVIYERYAENFFQANKFLRASMLSRAAEYADLNGEQDFLDIGCGVGFFTLYLATSARTGHGVDINKTSIQSALENAKLNKMQNVTFQAIPSSQINPFRRKYDVIIIDPPRAGLDKRTRRTLEALSSKRIVYVSCNPATFARDAKDLQKGGYKLEKLTMIDMFPCTYHIESIALFSRV